MYNDRKKAELKELCQENRLPTSGTKDVLIQRLQANIFEEPRARSPVNPRTEAEIVPNVVIRNPVGADAGLSDSSEEDITVVPNEKAHASSTPFAKRPSRVVRPDDVRMVLEEERMEFERYILEKERELLDSQRKMLLERERNFTMASATVTTPSEPRSIRFTVREIGDIMPEFDPTHDGSGSGSAERFIKRIRDLQAIYNWDDKLTLFAAQSKLRGYAKIWNDGARTVFREFEEFARELLRDFPTKDNETDVHIQMLNSVRPFSEPISEYIYRMSALGRKGGLKEEAIIVYVRRGINNTSLQNLLSCVEIRTLQELHKECAAG